ncbi:MAG: hypothetical protein Q9213_001572 [Squamulea squamosa]
MEIPEDVYGGPQRLYAAMAAGNPSLPVPVFLTFEEVNSKAKKYSQDIFTAQRDLVNILDRHEGTIIKRWLKRTTVQRQKVLTTAFPGIPLTHRPDFWAFRKESQPQLRSGTQYRDHWLLPSLNREDLSRPRNLLLFLRSRTRNPPGDFTNADANSVHIGHTTQALITPYLSGHTMLLAGQNTQEAYGRMVSWDEDDEAFDLMSRGTGLQPGEGLQVMEIQQRKMQFLLGCVGHILQDLSLNDLSIPKQPVPVLDYLLPETFDWSSLAQEIEEAPYKLQNAFDIGRLHTYVVARRNEAEDHIWSLREDPSYFHDVVLERSEHRQEKILTASGKAHPVLRQDIFWERVLSNVVMDAYANFVAWDTISRELDRLASKKSEYSDKISPDRELPKDFAHALAHFQYQIEEFTKGAIGSWKVGMVASPPLRQHYIREPQNPTTNQIQVTKKDASTINPDYLLWLLQVFLQDDQLFLCGLDNLCDELEREIRSNKVSRERISPYIASLISDLSLFGELKRQIGLATPGPRMAESIDEEERHAEFDKRTKLFRQIYKTLSSLGMGLAEFGTPLGKFNVPSHKRRTRATTQTMQLAERNLDLFWDHIDVSCRDTAGSSVHQMLNKVLQDRQLQRTPDWAEQPETQPLASIETSELGAMSGQLAALELQTRTENTVTAAISRAKERQKPKTRSAPWTSSSTATENLDVAQDHSIAAPIYEVSKRGFKVFTTLFYTATEEEPPGELPWSEFLSAMASVGFSIKKLDGSAWIFAPVGDAWKQSITFHEPHPGSKIPFLVARRFGRRLWRRYGWTIENFRRA